MPKGRKRGSKRKTPNLNKALRARRKGKRASRRKKIRLDAVIHPFRSGPLGSPFRKKRK